MAQICFEGVPRLFVAPRFGRDVDAQSHKFDLQCMLTVTHSESHTESHTLRAAHPKPHTQSHSPRVILTKNTQSHTKRVRHSDILKFIGNSQLW